MVWKSNVKHITIFKKVIVKTYMSKLDQYNLDF